MSFKFCTGLPVYHVLIMGDGYRPLGHVIFVRDCLFIMLCLGVITIGRWAMSFLYGTAPSLCVDYE